MVPMITVDRMMIIGSPPHSHNRPPTWSQRNPMLQKRSSPHSSPHWWIKFWSYIYLRSIILQCSFCFWNMTIKVCWHFSNHHITNSKHLSNSVPIKRFPKCPGSITWHALELRGPRWAPILLAQSFDLETWDVNNEQEGDCCSTMVQY